MTARLVPWCLAMLVPLSASGEVARGTPGPAPAVEELVAIALERSPAVAAARHRVEAIAVRETAAVALPDPMLEGFLQNAGLTSYTVGDEEMSMVGVEVRQELPYPGKRAARGALVRAEAGVLRAELERLIREVARDVRVLYAGLYALDREAETLAAARELVELLAATAGARYAAGEAEQEAVIKAQLEASRLAERSDDVETMRAELASELNRRLAREGGAGVGEVEALPEPVEPAGGPAPVADGAPEVLVAAAAVAAGEERLAAARLDVKPDFAGGVGVGLRGGLDPMLMLRFGVALPLWKERRQRVEVEAAALELAAAEGDRADAEFAAAAEIARWSSARDVADRQVLRYREAILPRTSAAFDAARSAYLAGRGDFSTVVENFELWLEARVELARRERDAYVARAELARLAGAGPEAAAMGVDREEGGP